ncbi:MAG TPA: glycosyltransferase [Steroidobacteraceae bacterium]|nr:glycosyltransferase [Steroidobacteraceae bacterium]
MDSTASQLRIALVTPMLPLPHDHSRGRYIYEIARGLARLTPTRVYFQQQRYPRLRLLQPKSYLYGLAAADYGLPGIDTETFSYPALPVVSRPFNSWISRGTLIPRLRAWHPDVVLSYWLFPDGHAATLAAHALKLPSVVGALGSDVHVRDRLNAWFTRRTLRGAEAVLSVAEQMRGVIIDRYGARPERVHTIINGYNTTVFHPQSRAAARLKLTVPAEARLIVYVGRLVEAKGLRELLGAFETLARENPHALLAFVGDGTMGAELGALVNRGAWADRILLPGSQSPEDVAVWLAASDTLCLPSWSEGYPNVVVEAIACGRPVVATDVGGTNEIVNASNGLLVPPRDPIALTDALRKVLARDWDYDGIARAIRRSWDDVAAETLAVCRQVVGDWRARAR